jgi:hypothetical protein
MVTLGFGERRLHRDRPQREGTGGFVQHERGQPKNPPSAPHKTMVQQQATPTPAQPVQPPTGPPKLRIIMWISTKPSAQLDTDWAFEGDHVRGYKVTKISHDSVDLLTPEGASLKLVLPAQVAGK